MAISRVLSGWGGLGAALRCFMGQCPMQPPQTAVGSGLLPLTPGCDFGCSCRGGSDRSQLPLNVRHIALPQTVRRAGDSHCVPKNPDFLGAKTQYR